MMHLLINILSCFVSCGSMYYNIVLFHLPTLHLLTAPWMSRPLSSLAVIPAPSTMVLKQATFRTRGSLETCVSVTSFWTSPPLSHPRECSQASPLKMTPVLSLPVITGPSVFPADSPTSVCVGLLLLARIVRKVRSLVAFGVNHLLFDVACLFVVDRDCCV